MTSPLPEWTERYIGLPWRAGGAEWSGLDCWGLLRLVLATEKGVELPNHSLDFPRGLCASDLRAEIARLMQARNDWRPIRRADARAFDGALIPLYDSYGHCAVMTGPDQAIHISSRTRFVAAADFRRPEWRGIADRIRFYRHPAFVD